MKQFTNTMTISATSMGWTWTKVTGKTKEHFVISVDTSAFIKCDIFCPWGGVIRVCLYGETKSGSS